MTTSTSALMTICDAELPSSILLPLPTTHKPFSPPTVLSQVVVVWITIFLTIQNNSKQTTRSNKIFVFLHRYKIRYRTHSHSSRACTSSRRDDTRHRYMTYRSQYMDHSMSSHSPPGLCMAHSLLDKRSSPNKRRRQRNSVIKHVNLQWFFEQTFFFFFYLTSTTWTASFSNQITSLQNEKKPIYSNISIVDRETTTTNVTSVTQYIAFKQYNPPSQTFPIYNFNFEIRHYTFKKNDMTRIACTTNTTSFATTCFFVLFVYLKNETRNKYPVGWLGVCKLRCQT